MHDVQRILEDIGYETRSYSGRGMYGKQCLGIELDEGMGSLFADILESIEPDDLFEMSKAFRQMQQDSLGMGKIIYFPSIPFEFDDEEDEEDDEG